MKNMTISNIFQNSKKTSGISIGFPIIKMLGPGKFRKFSSQKIFGNFKFSNQNSSLGGSDRPACHCVVVLVTCDLPSGLLLWIHELVPVWSIIRTGSGRHFNPPGQWAGHTHCYNNLIIARRRRRRRPVRCDSRETGLAAYHECEAHNARGSGTWVLT